MEPDTEVQDDRYFDPQLGMEISRSGRRRWRERLDEHRANRDTAALDALRAQLRLGPTAQA